MFFLLGSVVVLFLSMVKKSQTERIFSVRFVFARPLDTLN